MPKFLDDTLIEKLTHLLADGNYTIFNLKGGKRLRTSYCLKVFEGLLKKKSFIRISRTHLVKKSFIAGTLVRENCYYCKLKNNEEVLISRRRKLKLKVWYPKLFTKKNTL